MQLSSTALFTDPTLVVYYKLEDLLDSKGSNNLTDHNSVAFNAAKYNNGADGGSSNTNKYLSTTTAWRNFTQLTADWSVTFWVKFNTLASVTGLQRIWWNQVVDGSGHYHQVGLNMNAGDNTLTMFGGENNWVVNSLAPLVTGTQYHIVATQSGTTISFYINDVLQGTTTTSWASNNGGTSDQSTLLALVGGADFSSSIIDDFAVFSKALSTDEIFSLFTDGSASLSPSSSSSASASKSLSPSASLSPSQSQSPSASASRSLSPSASTSPSLSLSPSASLSPSSSNSASISPSSSTSPSISPSRSLSQSASASPSPTDGILSIDLFEICFSTGYVDEYAAQNTSFSNLYQTQSTSFLDEYVPQNTVFLDEYGNPC